MSVSLTDSRDLVSKLPHEYIQHEARVHPVQKKTHGMEDVELAPFERSVRAIRWVGGSRLDALDVANMLDVVDRAVAAVASQCDRGRNGKTADNIEDLHPFLPADESRERRKGSN